MANASFRSARSIRDIRGGEILMNIYIHDEQHKATQMLMDAVKKYWTCSKYEFIDIKELKNRCSADGFFLIYGGIANDVSNPACGWLALLRPSALTMSGNSFQGPMYVKTDKETGKEYLVYESGIATYTINTFTTNTSTDFFVALMNEIVNQRYINKVLYRCWNGKTATPEGMFLFDGYATDYFKDKTLLINDRTAYMMLKKFKDEATLKKIISKTTFVAEDKIHILKSDEFCKSFLSGKEDILYMYTYYSWAETTTEGGKGYWMAPNILNSQGKFVASLDNYSTLKKLHGGK
jgi:hypothetical protein